MDELWLHGSRNARMRSFDFITCAVRELKRAKFRTLLVITGYTFTVALMIVTANLLLFSRHAENQILSGTGNHFVAYMPHRRDMITLTEEELAGLAKGIIPQKCLELCTNCTGCNKQPIDLLNEGFIINTATTRLLSFDLVDKVKRLPTVKDASAYLLFRFRDPDSGRLFSVGGFMPDSSAVETICFSRDDMTEGNFIDEQVSCDISENRCCPPAELTEGEFLASSARGVAMADHAFAINMGLKPGDSIVIASESVTIAGFVNTGVRPARADVYMFFDDVERLVNRRIQNPLYNEANIILVETMSAAVHEQGIEDVKELVQYDSIITYGCYEPAAHALGINERSVWIFMLITFIGSVLFASKTQISAIIERKRQIAVLKALGWKNSSVSMQILSESIIQSFLGCLFGVLSGMLVLHILPVNDILGISVEVSMRIEPVLMLYIVGVAIFGGVISGSLPVLLILRQRPADVLRRLW